MLHVMLHMELFNRNVQQNTVQSFKQSIDWQGPSDRREYALPGRW